MNFSVSKDPIIVHESDKSELMLKTVKGDAEAYDLYDECMHFEKVLVLGRQ